MDLLPYMHIVLPSYSVMAFIGGFVTLTFLYFRFERYGLDFRQFIRLFVLCAFTCLMGSKILYFVVALLNTKESLDLAGIILLFLSSGFVFYGGLFGALWGIRIFLKHERSLDAQSLYQMAAPAFPLFHGFGRIGCLLAGCCYGVPLTMPVVLFETVQINLFPTQLIEALYEFALFIFLCCLEKLRNTFNLLHIYLAGYATFRFFIEYYRADTDRGMWLCFSTAQWISIFIIAYLATDYLKRRS